MKFFYFPIVAAGIAAGHYGLGWRYSFLLCIACVLVEALAAIRTERRLTIKLIAEHTKYQQNEE